jgi:transposase
MSKHKSTDYKLSAVEYYLDNDDLSLRDTCDIYKCSKYSLVRWVKRYLEYGTVENKDRKEGAYKVKKEHVKFIIDLIKVKPFSSISTVCSILCQSFVTIISKSYT